MRMNTCLMVFLCIFALFGIQRECVNALTVVLDNDYGEAAGYKAYGTWTLSSGVGYNGGKYWYTRASDAPSSASWSIILPETDKYDVYYYFRRGTDRTTSAPIKVIHAGGETIVPVNMRGTASVVSAYLGEFSFDKTTTATVILSNNGNTGVYISDTVVFMTAVDEPPAITNLARSPQYPQAGDWVNITAKITDNNQVSTATLFWSANVNKLSGSSAMLDDGNNNDGQAGDGVYGASIPPQPDGTAVSYYVSAWDNINQSTTSSSANYTVGVAPPKEYRCVWADSWNRSFLNQTEAQEIVDTCRQNNINTIMIEVRKIGDAYYNSSIEPRATNITGGSSYDPLGTLINLAHDTSGGKKYVQIHAWFVMHRISSGETLAATHVLSQHPEYIMSDSAGNTVGDGKKYLDPGHPGSVDHNVSVILDCLSKYNIDGINLDYIRYPEASGDWGYNPISVERYNSFYNKTGQPGGSDPEWDAWRRECVTNEVKKIYVKAMKIKRNVVLTADTVNWGYEYTASTYPVSSAYAGVFQDWVGWLQKGVFDYNALMNYSTSSSRYLGWMNLSLQNDDKRGSIIGIGAYLQTTIQSSMDQLLQARQAGAAGLNIYDWYSENAAATGTTRVDFYTALRTQVFTEWTDPPEPIWKTQPTTMIFEGNISYQDAPIDHASVIADGNPDTLVYSDGSGWYSIIDLAPGSHTLLFKKPGYNDHTEKIITTNAGDIITLNVTLSKKPQGIIVK